METKKYAVKCSNTTYALGRDCDWSGDISECKKGRDSGTWSERHWWRVWWNCPNCRSTCAELNQNSPLNHPLQEFD